MSAPGAGGSCAQQCGFTLIEVMMVVVITALLLLIALPAYQQQLQKTREDGTYVFTTQKPEFERYYGELKCLLHADDPNRETYDRMGLATCTKDNLTASHDLRVHMEKRHRREWATIDGERIDEERIRERQRQDNLSDAIKLLAERDTVANRQADQPKRGKSNG